MELHENNKKLCDVQAYKGGKIPIGQQFGQSAALETVKEFQLVSPVKPKDGMGTLFYLVEGDKTRGVNIHKVVPAGDKYILRVSLK